MGVAKNNLVSDIDKERVYMGGRYFLGLGKEVSQQSRGGG